MKHRVLIADDDVAIRDELKRVLEKADYEVLTAGDSDETEGRIASEPVDLLLLDLDLSRQNWWMYLAWSPPRIRSCRLSLSPAR